MIYKDEIRDLIVNMTMNGADDKELEKAIQYSTRVINAYKEHVGNYHNVCKKAYEVFHIEELEDKYMNNTCDE